MILHRMRNLHLPAVVKKIRSNGDMVAANPLSRPNSASAMFARANELFSRPRSAIQPQAWREASAWRDGNYGHDPFPLPGATTSPSGAIFRLPGEDIYPPT